MRKSYLLIISFCICLIGFIIIHNYSTIINKINNISLEEPNPKYTLTHDELTAKKKKTVSFGDVAKCGSFNIKILNVSEIKSLEFYNNTFVARPFNKYVLINFRVKNSSKSTSELYFCGYTLKNTSTNQTYYFSYPYDKIISKFCIYKNDKNISDFGNIESGIIKNAFILFEVPETDKLDDLVLESSTMYFKLN